MTAKEECIEIVESLKPMVKKQNIKKVSILIVDKILDSYKQNFFNSWHWEEVKAELEKL